MIPAVAGHSWKLLMSYYGIIQSDVIARGIIPEQEYLDFPGLVLYNPEQTATGCKET